MTKKETGSGAAVMKVYLLFSQALKEDPLVKLTFELKIKAEKAMWEQSIPGE